jgi:hypothetical protein
MVMVVSYRDRGKERGAQQESAENQKTLQMGTVVFRHARYWPFSRSSELRTLASDTHPVNLTISSHVTTYR